MRARTAPPWGCPHSAARTARARLSPPPDTASPSRGGMPNGPSGLSSEANSALLTGVAHQHCGERLSNPAGDGRRRSAGPDNVAAWGTAHAASSAYRRPPTSDRWTRASWQDRATRSAPATPCGSCCRRRRRRAPPPGSAVRPEATARADIAHHRRAARSDAWRGSPARYPRRPGSCPGVQGDHPSLHEVLGRRCRRGRGCRWLLIGAGRRRSGCRTGRGAVRSASAVLHLEGDVADLLVDLGVLGIDLILQLLEIAGQRPHLVLECAHPLQKLGDKGATAASIRGRLAAPRCHRRHWPEPAASALATAAAGSAPAESGPATRCPRGSSRSRPAPRRSSG